MKFKFSCRDVNRELYEAEPREFASSEDAGRHFAENIENDTYLNFYGRYVRTKYIVSFTISPFHEAPVET
jgi:hypothetical protein